MGRDALGLHRAIKVIRYEDFKSLESYQVEYYGIRHYAPFSHKYEGLLKFIMWESKRGGLLLLRNGFGR